MSIIHGAHSMLEKLVSSQHVHTWILEIVAEVKLRTLLLKKFMTQGLGFSLFSEPSL